MRTHLFIFAILLSGIAQADPDPYSEETFRHFLDEDPKVAFAKYTIQAQQGIAQAQRFLGNLYQFGSGTAQDFTKAALWYRKAAGQGERASQGQLAALYWRGQGVLQDIELAHMWASLSARMSGDGAQRDHFAKMMNTTEIARARELARKCFDSNYKNCDN